MNYVFGLGKKLQTKPKGRSLKTFPKIKVLSVNIFLT